MSRCRVKIIEDRPGQDEFVHYTDSYDEDSWSISFINSRGKPTRINKNNVRIIISGVDEHVKL